MINSALTPREFASRYLTYYDKIDSLDDLLDYMDNHSDDCHWYYTLDDIDFSDSLTGDVVLVEDPNTREVLWFEVDRTTTF